MCIELLFNILKSLENYSNVIVNRHDLIPAIMKCAYVETFLHG